MFHLWSTGCKKKQGSLQSGRNSSKIHNEIIETSTSALQWFTGFLLNFTINRMQYIFLWWYYEGSWLLLTLPFLFRMKFKLNGMIQFTFKFTYIYRGSWRDRRRQYCWSSLMSRYRNLTGVWRASASALTSSMWCSWASSSTSTPPRAPSSTRSCRPRTSSLCPPLRFVTNTSSQSKGLWLVSESYTYCLRSRPVSPNVVC